MFDIIVIGAGPAGLTAAIYARRAQKTVLVLEAMNYGGQIVNTLDIENYPGEEHISGFDFATKLYNQAKNLGTEFVFEKAFEIIPHDDYQEVRTNNDYYQAKAIILATGVSHRKLEISGEEKFLGKGVSYCATCDGNFFKGQDVAVVGGGDTALEDALYLSDISRKVYLIHRRGEFRGSSSTVLKITQKENVEILYNTQVIEILGDETLNSILVRSSDGVEKSIPVTGVFIAIGQIPVNDAFSNVVNLDENGYIQASENCQTNSKGVFVAGDNRAKEVRQLVTATSDGAVAAVEAIRYINNQN